MSGLFIVAGEPSGDRLGAALARRLRDVAPDLPLMGVGGEAMAAEGISSLFPMSDLSVMGLAEILPSLPRIFRRLDETAKAVAAARPAALITIDAQGFSARLQKRVKALSPQTARIHYVAPTVWAWKPWRARKIAGFLDHLMALFPFEPPYFTPHGLSCDFVGHPVAERVAGTSAADAEALAKELGLKPGAPVVVVLPGSRAGEVKRLAEPFRAALEIIRARSPQAEILLPMAAPVAEMVAAAPWPQGTHLIDPRPLPFAAAEARKFAAFRLADAALAASGSVSLELAACGAPMVIGYKANALTAALARRLIRIDTATLPNILAGERFIPEFFQEECAPEPLAGAVSALLAPGRARERQKVGAATVLAALTAAGESPSLKAARSVLAAVARKQGRA